MEEKVKAKSSRSRRSRRRSSSSRSRSRRCGTSSTSSTSTSSTETTSTSSTDTTTTSAADDQYQFRRIIGTLTGRTNARALNTYYPVLIKHYSNIPLFVTYQKPFMLVMYPEVTYTEILEQAERYIHNSDSGSLTPEESSLLISLIHTVKRYLRFMHSPPSPSSSTSTSSVGGRTLSLSDIFILRRYMSRLSQIMNQILTERPELFMSIISPHSSTPTPSSTSTPSSPSDSPSYSSSISSIYSIFISVYGVRYDTIVLRNFYTILAKEYQPEDLLYELSPTMDNLLMRSYILCIVYPKKIGVDVSVIPEDAWSSLTELSTFISDLLDDRYRLIRRWHRINRWNEKRLISTDDIITTTTTTDINNIVNDNKEEADNNNNNNDEDEDEGGEGRGEDDDDVDDDKDNVDDDRGKGGTTGDVTTTATTTVVDTDIRHREDKIELLYIPLMLIMDQDVLRRHMLMYAKLPLQGEHYYYSSFPSPYSSSSSPSLPLPLLPPSPPSIPAAGGGSVAVIITRFRNTLYRLFIQVLS